MNTTTICMPRDKAETMRRVFMIVLCVSVFILFPLKSIKAQPARTPQRPAVQQGPFRQPRVNPQQFQQIPQPNQFQQVSPRQQLQPVSPRPPQQPQQQQPEAQVSKDDLPNFSGEDAYRDLVAICELGPRISGSAGMRQQQQMIETRMTELGGAVTYQRFNVVHPVNRQLVELQNMIVKWHPERAKRIVLCCHYDTRPFSDSDPVNPQGEFLGANDGASGVVVLMELAKLISQLEGPWGIDLLFFDGEEFVYVNRRDPMFLGSGFFAQEYAAGRVDGTYSYGILLDMVGDKNLEIYYEKNSLSAAPGLLRSIWGVARELGYREFTAKKRHKIKDDHVPMNSVARIPTIDIIDFDYPTPNSKNAYWHTQQDIPENCSAASLGIVGSVMAEWLIQLEQIR